MPNLDAAKITTGTFAVGRGGTGLSTIALGGILYASALNILSRLAPTAANQVLRSTAANALQFAALLAADIPNLDASKIASGKFPLERLVDAVCTETEADNKIATALYTEGARVYHNTTQPAPTVTETTLAFNSERYDTDGIHDNAVNNSRLTCKTAGVYVIVAQVRFSVSATGYRIVKIRYNDTTVIGYYKLNVVNASHVTISATTIYPLSVDDFVTCTVYQVSGGSLNIEYWPQYTPEFMMQRIA
ncbi:hypothetical protein ES703_115889 [subsurface metagenome]